MVSTNERFYDTGVCQNILMPDRYRVPDTIIGIGGAGKSIVEHFMKKEYILDEMIRPAGDSEGVKTPVSAFGIDSDTEAKEDDQSEASRIRSKIQEVADRYERSVMGSLPSYEYVNLVDKADQMRLEASNLVQKPNVPEIAENAGIDCWWLRESEHMINVADQYTNGVERRRGLGKALLHASKAGKDPLHQVIREAASGDSCAMVVGLGGGTGSGMFLDIGKEVRERGADQLTLFAVLPKLDEGQDKKANAYAALSELERLAVTDQNPFTNIVLLPLEPASAYTEFDDAVVKTILSYYNLDNNHPELGDVDDGLTNHTQRLDESQEGNAPPMYAPFIVAVPQILYYVATEVEESRNRINDFIQNKQSQLEAEAALYDELEAYVTNHCADDVSQKLTEGGIKTLSLNNEQSVNLRENRITPLKELLSVDAFDQLGYTSAQRVLEKIDEIEEEIEAKYEDMDKVRHEKIQRIPEGIYESPDQIRPDSGAKGFEHDETLADLILSELEMISRRRDLLKLVNIIDDPVIKDGVESALHRDVTGVAGTAPEEAMQSLDIDTLKEEVEEIDMLTDAAEELHSELLSDWRTSVRSDVESLVEINERIDEIQSQINSFRSEVEADIQAVNNATRGAELPSQQVNYRKYKEIDDFLRSIGCDPVGIDDIEKNVQEVITAAEYWHDDQNSGMLDSVFGLVAGDDSSNRDTYVGISGRINQQYFQLAEWDSATFYCDINGDAFDKTADIEQRKEEHISSIIDSARGTVENVDSKQEQIKQYLPEQEAESDDLEELLDEIASDSTDSENQINQLEAELRQTTSPSNLISTVTDDGGVIYQLLWETLVEPIETHRQETQQAYETERAKQKQYDRLDDIICSESARFVNSLEDVEDPSEIRLYERQEGNGYSHKKEVVADEPEKLLGSEDIADANLWESPNEPELIQNRLVNEFINDRLTDTTYTALERGTIKHGAGQSGYAYDQHRLVSVLMSRAFDDTSSVDTQLLNSDTEVRGMRDTLTDNIYVPEDYEQYTESIVPFGGKWDMSITVFIGGVFLDNLSFIHNQNIGLKDMYEKERETIGDDILIRHAHGVDGRDTMRTGADGAYVYRDKVVNMNTGEIEMFTDPDINPLRKIKNEYQETVGFESTIDLSE